MVETRAGRQREPPRDVDIVLNEHARRRVAVGKPRRIDGLKTIALDRETGDEGVMRDRSPQRQFGKSRVVMIALRNLAEAMILILRRPRPSGAPHDAVGRERLKRRPDIRPTCVEPFNILAAGRRTSPGIVPPVRFSHVPPAVAKNDVPALSSQNTRGRTTARAYFGMSAQLSPFTSPLACPLALPSSVSPQLLASGVSTTVPHRLRLSSMHSAGPGVLLSRRDASTPN